MGSLKLLYIVSTPTSALPDIACYYKPIIYQYLVTIVFIITEFVYRSTGCVYVYTDYYDFVSMNVVSS